MHDDLKEEAIIDMVGGRFKLSALIQKRMAELMQEHDAEQRQILDRIPDRRGITPIPAAHLIHGDQKPRPMHMHVDPGNLKQAKGASLRR